MKLFLIRHGQTVTNLEKRWTGQSDVALTEQGRWEAEQIRPILAGISFDRVYSSDLSRAVDTQKLALPGALAEQTPLLREFDVGTLTGLPYDQVPPPQNGKRNYADYGGESNEEVCDRIRKFLKILEADPCKNVAAFVHNGIMNCMLRVVLQSDFVGGAVKSNNCAINVFEFDGTRWRLIAWNYMGKL